MGGTLDTKMKTAFEYPIYVECTKCGSKFDEADVKFETNIFEQDMRTFECPRCGNIVKSLRYGCR